MYKGSNGCRLECLEKLRRCDASKDRNSLTARVKLSIQMTEYAENEGATSHLVLSSCIAIPSFSTDDKNF